MAEQPQVIEKLDVYMKRKYCAVFRGIINNTYIGLLNNDNLHLYKMKK